MIRVITDCAARAQTCTLMLIQLLFCDVNGLLNIILAYGTMTFGINESLRKHL